MNPEDVVPFAREGAVLEGRRVEKKTIRGVESAGMLCSEKELGIGVDHSGLLVLPPDTQPGTPLEKILELDDVVMDLGITPNRGDCLSVRGVAREAAAAFGKTCVSRKIPVFENASAEVGVRVEDPELCPVYGGAVLENLTLRPSPFSLRYRLFLIGIRPINNIIDITNFVLADLGQPMHAFDIDTLCGKCLVVRRAVSGETLRMLDGVDRELDASDLVIADSEKPVALAGIMGGEPTAVNGKTRTVFLESAFFRPARVRSTSNRLGVKSESSYRFERGTDIGAIPESLRMASDLAARMGGARVVHAAVNLERFEPAPRTVEMRTGHCRKVLGENIGEDRIREVLSRIGIESMKGQRYRVPTFRHDLEREIDLVEEVARLHGYGRIPENTEVIEVGLVPENPVVQVRHRFRTICAASGLLEAVNYSFVGTDDLVSMEPLVSVPKRPWTLANPLTPDQAVMRNSLFSGLARNHVHSRNYRIPDLALFEVGGVFREALTDSAKLPRSQTDHGAFILGGKISKAGFDVSESTFDFFDAKGVVHSLFDRLGIDIEVRPVENAVFEKGFGVFAGEACLGCFGVVSVSLAKKYASKDSLYYGEFSLEAMARHFRQDSRYTPVPRFPFIREDMSFLVDDHVTHESILRVIENKKIPILENVSIFDIFKGKNIPKGKKSVAYSLTYRDPDSTLTSEDVKRRHEEIKKELSKALNAEFR
jgi:phenylalanyl-tRNA synthetase beta chain